MAGAGHEVVLESWRAQYPRLLYPGQLTVDEPELPLFHPTRRTLSWRRPDGWMRAGRRIGRSADLVVLQYHSTIQVLPYLGIWYGLRGTGARVVLIANNVRPHEGRMLDERLVRALLRRVDGLLVHSEEQAALAHAMTAAPVRVEPLPPHLPAQAETAAAEPGQLHNRLLFFGLVRAYKGLDVLLRALARARFDAHLTVAGEFWGGAAETRQLVAELGLADRVTLREGYVAAADIPALFAAADALVLPYRHATGSQNTLLAFEHGLPVIVTRTGALADPVTDGVDGIVCEPDDVPSLARAIERFYQPGAPARLRANVTPPDPGPAWKPYIEALTVLGTPGSTAPRVQ
jgi:glycosyltransferase involved in cell wall biosynthesis